MDNIFLTQEKYNELKARLKDYETSGYEQREGQSRRGGLADSWHETAAYAATQAAFEMKLLELKQIIKKAKILNKIRNNNKVELGAFVELEFQEKLIKYRLVDPIEADPSKDYISWDSPIGIELRGKKVGDMISVNDRNFTLKKIY